MVVVVVEVEQSDTRLLLFRSTGGGDIQYARGWMDVQYGLWLEDMDRWKI